MNDKHTRRQMAPAFQWYAPIVIALTAACRGDVKQSATVGASSAGRAEVQSPIVFKTVRKADHALIELSNIQPDLAHSITPATRIVSTGPDSSVPSFNISGAQLTSTSVFVGDAATKSIVQYSLTGEVKRRIGGHGSGPGEFQTLSHLYSYRADSLIAVDFQARRLTLFDPQGKAIRIAPLDVPVESVGAWVDLVASSDNGVVLYGARPINRGSKIPRDVRYDITLFSGNFDQIRARSLGKARDALNHEGVFTDIGEIPLSGSAHFATAGGLVFVSDPELPSVAVFDTLWKLQSVIQIDVSRAPILPKHENAERDRLRDELRVTHVGVPERFMVGFRKYIDEIQFPDSFPSISGLFATANGKVLVELFAPLTQELRTQSYLLIDMQTQQARTFKLEPGVRAFSFRNEIIAAVRTDASGDQSVELYEIPP